VVRTLPDPGTQSGGRAVLGPIQNRDQEVAPTGLAPWPAIGGRAVLGPIQVGSGLWYPAGRPDKGLREQLYWVRDANR
jgi:hypothetical protein